MSFRDFIRSFVFGAPPVNVPDRHHPELGRLVWDSDAGFWNLTATDGPHTIQIALWGDARSGPNEIAVRLIRPLLPKIGSVVSDATNYLAQELTREVRHKVDPNTLTCDGISVYAGKHPTVEVDFLWTEQPDWLLRVAIAEGRPASWAFDR